MLSWFLRGFITVRESISWGEARCTPEWRLPSYVCKWETTVVRVYLAYTIVHTGLRLWNSTDRNHDTNTVQPAYSDLSFCCGLLAVFMCDISMAVNFRKAEALTVVNQHRPMQLQSHYAKQ